MHLATSKMSKKKINDCETDVLQILALTTLALLSAIVGTDATHLYERKSVGHEDDKGVGTLTLAFRQTVHALEIEIREMNERKNG
jgi:hypothetical protein